MYNLIENMPEEDRPREKLYQNGAGSLQDSELLAILLGTGSLGMSTIDLARHILTEYDSLERLSKVSMAELMKIRGVGKAKAASISALFELSKRFRATMKENHILDKPEIAANHLYPLMAYKAQEVFYVLHLGTKNNLLRSDLVTQGILNQTCIDPREIFRRAIRESAAKIIIAHNHPSGNPKPSIADKNMTTRLIEVGKIIGIPIVDHLIIGNATEKSPASYYAFSQNGFFIP